MAKLHDEVTLTWGVETRNSFIYINFFLQLQSLGNQNALSHPYRAYLAISLPSHCLLISS